MKINTSFNTTSNSNDFISEDSRLVDQNNILTKMSMTLIYDKCTIIPFNKDWHTIWNEDTCRHIKGTYPFHIYLRLGIIYLNKMIISISFIILLCWLYPFKRCTTFRQFNITFMMPYHRPWSALILVPIPPSWLSSDPRTKWW